MAPLNDPTALRSGSTWPVRAVAAIRRVCTMGLMALALPTSAETPADCAALLAQDQNAMMGLYLDTGKADAEAPNPFWLQQATELGNPMASQLIVRQRNAPERQACRDSLAAKAEAARQAERYRVLASGAQRQKIVGLVERLAPLYGVHPGLAVAIIRAESNFDPLAISLKNAQGLMQLIPETAERFAVKDAFNAEQNIRGGLAYLRWLLSYFQGEVVLVAAAYNAGEGTVDRHLGVPPFPETLGYIRRVQEVFNLPQQPFDAKVTAPSSAMPRILARLQP